MKQLPRTTKLNSYHTPYLLTKCYNYHHHSHLLPFLWSPVNVRSGKGTLSLSVIRPGPFVRAAPGRTVGPRVQHDALWSLIKVRIYRAV